MSEVEGKEAQSDGNKDSSDDEDGDLECLVAEEADEDTEDDEDNDKDDLVFFHKVSQLIETEIRTCF